MSTLIWFILITAFMFFMHRGHGSHGGGMGCCGGGHAHGGHDHSSHDEKDHHHDAKPDIAAIPDAEYEVLGEEPVREIDPHREDIADSSSQHKHISKHFSR